MDRDRVALGGAPAELPVHVRALRPAALGGIDRAEPVDAPGAYRALRDLAGATPGAAVMRRRERQADVRVEPRGGLGERVEPLVVRRMVEGAVGGVPFHRDQRLQRVARRRQEREIALGPEHPSGRLDDVLLDDVPGLEAHGARGREVAELDDVGALEHLGLLHRLRDQEVQVRVALPVRVGSQVDG